MKLLFCRHCQDIFSLKAIWKSCCCGKSEGIYTDPSNAIYKGDCVPIGFVNNSFVEAVKNQPQKGMGEDFVAFVIPQECHTMTKIEQN